jgi:hypothetical protein
MEALIVDPETYDNIEGYNDLETVAETTDNLFKRRQKKRIKRIKRRTARRVKRKTRKAKRKTRRATKLAKRGKTKRAARVKKRAARATKKAVKKQKRGAKRVKRVETKGTLGQRLMLAPLNPLKPIMVKALKTKGLKFTNKSPLLQVVNEFYNKIVRGKDKTLEEVDLLSFYDDHVIGDIAGSVVTAVIDFIKKLKKNKAEGKPLTKTEEKIVKGTEVVETKIKEKAEDEAAATVGKKLLFDKKTQLIIGGVVVMIIIIAVVIARKK